MMMLTRSGVLTAKMSPKPTVENNNNNNNLIN